MNISYNFIVYFHKSNNKLDKTCNHISQNNDFFSYRNKSPTGKENIALPLG